MRWYGYPALASLLVCQFLLFHRVEPVYTFFTPLQWWAYIFLADAIVWGRQKKSLITDRPMEFVIMLVLSNLCWILYEGYNFLLHNWYYTGLCAETWKRILGYSTSFATIFPGIFITADLLESFGLFRDRDPRPRKLSSTFLIGSLLGGLSCAVFPVLFPSPYVFGLVWIAYFFLLEPINYWMKSASIYEDIEKGRWQRFWLLLAAGAVCGGLWEFWNYWAHAKWVYTVPFTRNIKYFEMPVLGLLGFPPFALECFSMYHFSRRLLGK